MIFTKQVIVKTSGKGVKGDPLKVNLPAYQIVEILPGNKAKIIVPDDEVDDKGNLSKDKIRQKYRGQKWDIPEVCDDVIV